MKIPQGQDLVVIPPDEVRDSVVVIAPDEVKNSVEFTLE